MLEISKEVGFLNPLKKSTTIFVLSIFVVVVLFD